MVRDVLHQLADDALAVEKISGRGDIHDLAGTVGTAALFRFRQHLRVHLFQPGGNGVGRRADDDVDSGFVHGVHDPVNMGIVKNAGTGFQRRPGGFGDADEVDARFLHHPDILVQTVIGHVFVIIRDAVIEFFQHDNPPFVVVWRVKSGRVAFSLDCCRSHFSTKRPEKR